MSLFPHEEYFHHPGPDVGEHSDEILQEFGFDEEAIEKLRGAGAI